MSPGLVRRLGLALRAWGHPSNSPPRVQGWDYGEGQDVGPLQALIDELEFNLKVTADSATPDRLGCHLLDDQFRRAVREGAIAILQEDLKSAILDAYVAIGRANPLILAVPMGEAETRRSNEGLMRLRSAEPVIQKARDALLQFLGSES